MIQDLQLAALVAEGSKRHLLRIPLTQPLQEQLGAQWHHQYELFCDDVEEVDFDPGFTPDDHHRFKVDEFTLPDWLESVHSRNINELQPLNRHEDTLDRVKGIVGFAEIDGEEVILFQNFSRSHIIEPGRFLLLAAGSYISSEHRGLTLSNRLAAVLYVADSRLLFCNFRAANVILPLAHLYREASEDEVREVLSHERLAPVNLEALASNPSQWFRKHIAMLRDSTVLDDFSAQQLRARARNVGVAVTVRNGKLVFPSDKDSAKRLLQFLSEELFRGAITNTLYATNSKRAAN